MLGARMEGKADTFVAERGSKHNGEEQTTEDTGRRDFDWMNNEMARKQNFLTSKQNPLTSTAKPRHSLAISEKSQCPAAAAPRC